jgi:hypothetical protein
VAAHPVAQSREVWLRFRGLPFARWDDGRVFFGINDAREELTPVSRPSLKRRLHELELHQRYVYAQVLANAGGEHDILDLLTVTRSGRLAIIELKASEHMHLPLQAADYWLRVRRHLENGEIARYGYFQEIALQQASPLVYLVAPALRFHPTTDDL